MYEGYTAADVAFMTRVLAGIGVRSLVVTNAAGALNESYSVGDFMVFGDHIFLPGLSGHHPLAGDEWDGTFLDMSGTYDASFRSSFRAAGTDSIGRVHEGTYAMVHGPTFETRAEARALRHLGADAVGMSTLPEVIVARSLGLRVLAVSAITNVIDLRTQDARSGLHDTQVGRDVGTDSAHNRVLSAAASAAPALAEILRRWISSGAALELTGS
jgi:purine-nucleoside phosphorylase